MGLVKWSFVYDCFIMVAFWKEGEMTVLANSYTLKCKKCGAIFLHEHKGLIPKTCKPCRKKDNLRRSNERNARLRVVPVDVLEDSGLEGVEHIEDVFYLD